jgi:hypothetical protein
LHLVQHRRKPRHVTSTTPSIIDHLRYARFVLACWWSASPLNNATRRLFRWLSDGNLLNNVYEQQVVAYPLPDGRQMLFRDSEMFPAEKPQSEDDIRNTADHIVTWTRALTDRGMNPIALLLPTRFTLYGPWLVQDDRRAGVSKAVEDFYRLEAELKRRGVRTVNGLQIFQQTAPQDLSTGELPFYREDNHWQPEGVERIARVLADSLRAPSQARAPKQVRQLPSRAN